MTPTKTIDPAAQAPGEEQGNTIAGLHQRPRKRGTTARHLACNSSVINKQTVTYRSGSGISKTTETAKFSALQRDEVLS